MNTLNDYFDHIYCLNLAYRTDRWSDCLTLFEKYELKVQRFEAVDGRAIKRRGKSLNNGEAAIILSVLQILKDAVCNEYKSILILEDDIEFMFEKQRLDEYMKSVPQDYDILYFGGNHDIKKAKFEVIDDKVIKIYHTLTSHCIGFKNNNNLFDNISYTINNFEKQLDCYYTDLQKVYNVYCFYPGIATQRPSFSDIQNVQSDNRTLINRKHKI